ncbi:MAG: cation transporter [Ignavibacterium sp.]|nr:MAG: cation transporter [Ignavibacterium sp.]
MSIDINLKLKKRAAYLSIFVGISMLFAKSGAYLITGSAAIFSDAAESVIHILATTMALYSIIISSKPADDSHMYGHGNVEYFSAGIEGALIIVAAIVIIYHAVDDIVTGTVLKSLNIGVTVIAGAGVINLLLGLYLIKTGKKTDSLTLIADGKHILTDSVTSIGVLVGIVIVMITNITILDPLVAIAVALNILVTGYKLMRESVGGLMLETNPNMIERISKILILIKKDYWIDLHELRYWKSGDRLFIDFHLTLPYYFTIKQTHKEEEEISAKLEEEFINSQIKIHFDFCKPELCAFCLYDDCKVRVEKHSINFDWDVKKLTGDAVHLIHPAKN